jgi:hypothetical protein
LQNVQLMAKDENFGFQSFMRTRLADAWPILQ